MMPETHSRLAISNILAVLLVMSLCVCVSSEADTSSSDGLVAHYNFNKGAGDTLHDVSGNGHDGKIHNAMWGDGALKFSRTNSFVDFGMESALKMAGDTTIMAWVMLQPEPYPDFNTNWTIIDCEEYRNSGYIMRIDGNTSKLRYRSSQDGTTQQRSSSISFAINTFYHVAVTKKGNTATFFINGSADHRFHMLNPEKGNIPFMISSKDQSFNGLMDAKEVEAAYKKTAAARHDSEPLLVRQHIDTGLMLKTNAFTVRFGDMGNMQVDVGGDTYFVESSFSFPGPMIGHNVFALDNKLCESLWRPQVSGGGDKSINVTAVGRFYRIDRTLHLQDHRVTITDKITNIGNKDVGVLVSHALIAEKRPTAWRLCGVTSTAQASEEENPTVLLSQQSSHLGAVVDDNVSRAQFNATAASNHVNFGLKHLGLAPKASLTLQWHIYPLKKPEDYWTFINRIRNDWKVNFLIQGPADFIHLTRNRYWHIFRDKEACKAFLDRTNLKVLQVGWLDFNHHNTQTSELISRKQFKEMMQEIKQTIKAVDPQLLLVGNVEAPWVSLPRSLCEQLYTAAPAKGLTTFGEFTSEQMVVLNKSPELWRRWKDAAVWSKSGKAQNIFYTRHRKDGSLLPMFGLTVYPKLGNGQHDYLMEQARFIIEEAGLDGVYFDSFTSHLYSYDKWDGTTVDIDPATGKITSRYTDCTLAGSESRQKLIEYSLTAGKVCIINGHAIARETRSLHANRFDETFSYIDPLALNDGEKPPLVQQLCRAHLSSPIGLGFKPDSLGAIGASNYAKAITKAVIGYLRHGVLYHHYETFIPENGPASGEYGPVNHMFPITPVGLGAGFVEGEQRVITCVSRTFTWPGKDQPKILLFDITGREKSHTIKPVKVNDEWRVKIKLIDWQEIAVLEP
jgi:hypothetical protein